MKAMGHASTMGLWCDVVPGDAAATNWDHIPVEESRGTDLNSVALALLERWAGVPVALGRVGPSSSGPYLAPLGLGRGGSVLGRSCVKRLSSLLLLLSIGVEVRGFCPWVPNAARAGSGGELRSHYYHSSYSPLVFGV